MKRTPLKRKSLKTRSPPRKSAYALRERDFPYMEWIRSQPCAAGNFAAPCSGRVEADHAGRRHIGRKAPDDTCIPLCGHHHRQRDNFHGPFKHWNQQQMREWLAALVVKYQEMYANRSAVILPCLEKRSR